MSFLLGEIPMTENLGEKQNSLPTEVGAHSFFFPLQRLLRYRQKTKARTVQNPTQGSDFWGGEMVSDETLNGFNWRDLKEENIYRSMGRVKEVENIPTGDWQCPWDVFIKTNLGKSLCLSPYPQL